MPDAASFDLDAWRVVLEYYPGWSHNVEIWARSVAGDAVELVAIDRAVESRWLRYVVDPARGELLAEEVTPTSDWAALGYRAVTPEPVTLDRMLLLHVHIRSATSAPDRADRIAAARTGRALIPVLRAELAAGALEVGYPDHDAARDDLDREEAALVIAERALGL